MNRTSPRAVAVVAGGAAVAPVAVVVPVAAVAVKASLPVHRAGGASPVAAVNPQANAPRKPTFTAP